MTLRARLLAGFVLLFVLGLLSADVALYSLLAAHLRDRSARQLDATADRVSTALRQPYALNLIAGLQRAGPPDGPRVTLLGDDGRPVLGDPPPYPGGAWLSTSRAADARPVGAARPVTRVYVAVSLAADQALLRRLVLAEAAVSVVIAAGASGLALAVLRVGLRPVSVMAHALSGGGHVPVPAPADELRELGTALNRALDQRNAAEEQLRRFVADASHELRTPLTMIQGWADLYFQPEPVDTDLAMARIAEAAGGMARLVEELLLLARLDERRPPARIPVDLGALAAEVVADLAVLDPGRPFTTELPPAVVSGDPDRLRQVVRNLVGNTLRHTPSGTPVLVSLRSATTTAELTVADAGPGIPAADATRVFDRFFHTVPDERRPGAGLGLAIVRAIVVAHGGTVELVEGTRYPGANFRVVLPSTAED